MAGEIMEKRILYHGSACIIERPEYGKGQVYNDYGQGFYCTEHIELAREWACSENADGYVNRYEIDTSGLSILNLSSEEYHILNWLAILMKNRVTRLGSPLAIRSREYLIENFLPDYERYDIIVGYRADDSYFSFARAFVMNGISLKQLGYAMRLGKLGEQFVLKSQRAFDAIRYMDFEPVDNNIYFAKRKARDDEARLAYQKEQENEDLDGIFMRDILREGMKNDDARLR